MALVELMAITIIVGTVVVSLLMLPIYFVRKKKNPDNIRNTIKRLIITSFIGVTIFTGLCVLGYIMFGKALINSDENSVTIIGGADGPTSVFIAGELGDDDMGYTNIIEFSGIIDWIGEVTKD